MVGGFRHPDFEKIHGAFLARYSGDPQLGESRYAEWVSVSGLDESMSYYSQGVARAAKSAQSFEWANFLLQFVKEDQAAKYYKVEALFPVESMNGEIFTNREVLQAARSLTGKPNNLNHDPNRSLEGVEIVAAQYEDDCVECLVRVPKCSPLIGMIDRKEIVNVSIEGDWSHGIPGCGLVLTGLAWLTKDTTLPGIPLTRISPVEQIVESFTVSSSPPANVSASQNVQSGVSCVKERKWENRTLDGRVRFLEVLEQVRNQELTREEVEAKLSELNQKKDALYGVLDEIEVAVASAVEAEREKHAARQVEVSGQLDLLWAEISAYQEVLKKLIVDGEGESGVEAQNEGNAAASDEGTDPQRAAAAEKMLVEVKEKLKAAEGARDEVMAKLAAANKTIEQLKSLVPGVDLLSDPPVLMSVVEHVAVLEDLLPPIVVERSSLGMQRQAQAIRAAILRGRERLK